MECEKRVDGLTPKQEAAIVALMTEHNVQKAAASVKVSHTTMYRWFNDEAFSKAYRKARRDAFSQAIGLTQRYAALAVNTLAQVMTDKDAPAHAKVTAAATLLKFGREGIELDDLAARVEQLEALQETKAKMAA